MSGEAVDSGARREAGGVGLTGPTGSSASTGAGAPCGAPGRGGAASAAGSGGSPPEAAWLEVTVRAPDPLAFEGVVEALFGAGATGVEELDPDPEGRPRGRAYLPPERVPLDARPLAKAGGTVVAVRREVHRDWTTAWRAGLSPLALGERFAICPRGTADDAPPGRIVIHLDPGAAFGTGLHPTTRLALELLERGFAALPAPAAAIDIGTGSGILGVAAWKLGARPVLAIDVDPLAVLEAEDNARQNGCREAFEVSDRPLASIAARFDLVIANLEAPLFAACGSDVLARVAPGGQLVVSGLRQGEPFAPLAAEGVAEALGFRAIEAREQGGWRAERWERTGEAPAGAGAPAG